MFLIDKIKSKPLAILITLGIISVITFFDYISGAELSFSVFYLIPITFLALTYKSTRINIIIISFISAGCWYVVDLTTNEYSHPFYPFWNAHMRLIIFLIIGLLVLNFREKQNKLNETNTKLKHLNDEKNKFIGIAAHDIRNPVSGIYSFSELLIDDHESKMNKEETEIVNHIKSLSQNILDLIKNLLDVSKIESGIIELDFLHQDYIKFINEQVHINRLLAKKKDITIHFKTDKNELLADFDSHHLSEVMNNLLSNAIKYSDKDSIITVKVTEEDNTVLTEIIDHGMGIPLEEQNKLFNYFQRTSTKPTDGETSTGLGLAIVKKIILALNGSIGVKSTVNEGSNFYFSFPIENQ